TQRKAMKDVDRIMEECPLKHHIRVTFWARFISKLPSRPVKYLTLYSPPIMDVKYFHSMGLLAGDEEVYPDVVGITYDKKAFAAANERIGQRLSLLLYGDVNKLLSGTGHP